MERHRCKLCNKKFSNGRALGGHMRSHLATFPLPLKKNQTESDSSSNSSDDSNAAAKAGFYELRENPRKSSKCSVLVQDGESEAESTQYPTRRRSKRVGSGSKWVGSETPTDESTQLSSVSDDLASQDEELARCLMMLSRDAWVVVEKTTTTTTRVAKFKCGSCNKVFRTSRALEGHKASNKQCCQESNTTHLVGRKIFECPFCSKVFGSGQALGGHKRSHLILLGSSSSINNNNKNNNVDVIVASNNIMTTNTTTTSFSNDDKVGDSTSSACFILDLNLPPPLEIDEDFVA